MLHRPQSSIDGLASAMSGVKVDLNPHQVDAALFALKSPLSNGSLLADEVGLGKTIEAGLVLAQYWSERRRRILLVVPASLRTQWRAELSEKFYIESIILESKNYNKAKKDGVLNPFDIRDQVVICSYNFVSSKENDVHATPWDLVIIDEAHRLRNVYKSGNVMGRKLRQTLTGKRKLLLTATPLQNNLMELYGLVSIIDEHVFGDARTLRASASETLTEQTIGRGLRLPFGQRTGVDEVDRLSIVSHDRYEAIVNLANNPDSLVRRVFYIDPAESKNDDQRETVELPTVYDELTQAVNFTKQLAFTLRETASPYYVENKTPEQTVQVAQFVAQLASRTVIELGKQVKTFNATKDEETMQMVRTSIVSETIRQFPTFELKPEDLKVVVEEAIETCVQTLTDKVIPIPQGVVQPFTEVKHGFYDFPLDTRNLSWHPSDDTLIGTELHEGGETFEYEANLALFPKADTVENEIVRHIIVHDNVDYSSCSELIYSLIANAKRHFLSYLNSEETEKVMRDRQRSLAEIIYTQMNQHFYKEETSYRASGMRPFTRIETGFGGKFRSDNLYDLRADMPASEVKTKIFKGFKKACHTLYKFDSNTERVFAIVLENDHAVLKWLRPSSRQFNIYYGPGGASKYEPDFIVETADTIYMVETKASDEINSNNVKEKAIAAQEYCRAVSEWNADNDGKPWEYALLSHDEVRLQSSFVYLMKNRVRSEQLKLEVE